MALGPGKYDEECLDALHKTQALGTLLMVFEGTRGSGFSVTAGIGVIRALPKILRDMADQIESDNAGISKRTEELG